jgi:beta-phosphoglucomutase-like phosphatase (HAD superfamily)
VFVGSPSNIDKERKTVVDAIEQWNASHSENKDVILHAVRWESHATGDLKGCAQDVINTALADTCDFLIALFWTTLGQGGTVDEIRRFRDAGKRVLLLFSQTALPQNHDPRQWKKLLKFRSEIMSEGLIHEFSTEVELREQLTRGINNEVDKLLANDLPTSDEVIEVRTGATNVSQPPRGVTFISKENDVKTILSNRLQGKTVRNITVVSYTNEVEFSALIKRFATRHDTNIEIYKRSLIADLAEEQECNLQRLAFQQPTHLRRWDKCDVSRIATTTLEELVAHSAPPRSLDSGMPEIGVRHYFFDQPPTMRAYLFDSSEAIVGYYDLIDDPMEEGGSVYKGMRTDECIWVWNQSRIGRFLLAELNEHVKALRRVSRTWEEEQAALTSSVQLEPAFDTLRKPCIRPKAVFLDLDGVLYDSLPFYVDAWQYALHRAGIEISEEEVYRHEGRRGRETIEFAFRRAGREHECSSEVIDSVHRDKNERLVNLGKSPLQIGAKGLLEAIAGTGLPVSIVTGSSREGIVNEVKRDFERQLSPVPVISGADTRFGKPDPEPYRVACRTAGIRPEDAVVIENAPLGIESATRSGCFCIAVNTGILDDAELRRAGARVVFRGIEELRDNWSEVIEILRANKSQSVG